MCAGPQVYVEVKVTEPLDFFLLRLDDCWATQTSDPNITEGLSHKLLDKGYAGSPPGSSMCPFRVTDMHVLVGLAVCGNLRFLYFEH